ncbi:hypothetical protein [Litorivivens sp.]
MQGKLPPVVLRRVVAILALITGGSAGIGLACAKRFDREGVTIDAFI